MNKKRIIILVVILVILIAILFYLQTLFKPQLYIDYSSTNIGSNEVIVSNDLIDSNLFNQYHKGDMLKINLNSKDFLLKLVNVESKTNSIVLSYNSENLVYLSNFEKKGIDFDSDSYYDVIITMGTIKDDNVMLAFKEVHEPVPFNEIVDYRLNKVVNDFQKYSNIQFTLIIGIIIIILIMVVIYFFFTYIIPIINLRKALAREKPKDALGYLLNEFDSAIKTKDMVKANKLFTKIKHLYDYLSNDEKEKFKSKIKSRERYIK